MLHTVMVLRVFLPVLVIYGFFLLGHSTSAAKTDNVFYLLGSDGIYVIDPVEKSVVAKITERTAPGLCANTIGSTTQSCRLTHACVVKDTVFVGDTDGNAVHVIDIKSRRKIDTIPTDDGPLRLYCLPWRKEVWVQIDPSLSMPTDPYSFNVIETGNRTRTRVLQTQLKADTWKNTMLANQDMFEGKTAFVTDYNYPGIHELNLETKNYTSSRNFSKYGCTSTQGIAYNPYNKHVYVGCVRKDIRSPSVLIELDTVDGNAKKWNFTGTPFVSPDGRYVVLHSHSFLSSAMIIFAVDGTGINGTSYYAHVPFTDQVSTPVFYPKGKNSDSYYVFLALSRSNKMAVVDLELAKNGRISDVKYIEDVDFDFPPQWQVQRDLFIADKWILSPQTGKKGLAIVNAETRKIHGKVSGAKGHFAVWVPGPTQGTSRVGHSSCLIFLIVLYVFM